MNLHVTIFKVFASFIFLLDVSMSTVAAEGISSTMISLDNEESTFQKTLSISVVDEVTLSHTAQSLYTEIYHSPDQTLESRISPTVQLVPFSTPILQTVYSTSQIDTPILSSEINSSYIESDIRIPKSTLTVEVPELQYSPDVVTKHVPNNPIESGGDNTVNFSSQDTISKTLIKSTKTFQESQLITQIPVGLDVGAQPFTSSSFSLDQSISFTMIEASTSFSMGISSEWLPEMPTVPTATTTTTKVSDESAASDLTDLLQSKTSEIKTTWKPYFETTSPINTTMGSIDDSNLVEAEWFLIIMDGNCSLAVAEPEEFKNILKHEVSRWLLVPRKAITNMDMTCDKYSNLEVNITAFPSHGTDLSALLGPLENYREPLLIMRGQKYYIGQIKTKDGYLYKEPDIINDRHANVELIIYVALGSTCLFLLLLAVGLLICKYCDFKGHKPLDFSDPQNMNVNLEDYTLTRIPRPRLSYADYCRGRNAQQYHPLDDKVIRNCGRSTGMVQPFDTSVVPLEDARILDMKMKARRPCSGGGSHRDEIIVKPSTIFQVGSHRTARYSSHGDCDQWESECVRSNENLRDMKRERMVDKGIDNPNFH